MSGRCWLMLAALVCGPAARAQDVEVLPVQGNVYMLAGEGGNVAVQVGKSGVLVVDTGSGASPEKVLAALRKLSPLPVRYILNTSADRDHTGGNAFFSKTFGSLAEVSVVNTPGSTAAGTVQILAHDNVLARMSMPARGEAAFPEISWPTETYTTDTKELFFNDESIQMLHAPAAHSDGDSMVYFRRSDVLVEGDLFVTTGYPAIELEKGGSLQGIIDGVNRALDIAIPKHHEEGGTYIIPGHGRICDEFDLSEYRDMLTIVRDRLQAMINRGMSLEQVKAARPTRDYDPEFAPSDGSWTASRFVEAAYRSLAQAKK
ncbi:MAG TPA: MBL fold metallo-hydrolase [Bryobacteraceae bacterium]|nr:MBL fold metallo-hydrolase [Bryobacteraceae bacterium]